jgi:FG-GAP-like repeat
MKISIPPSARADRHCATPQPLFSIPRFAITVVIGVLYATAGLGQTPVPFVNLPLVPSISAPGGPSFTLTVNGTNFVSGATVRWNGATLETTFVNAGQLKAVVPSANLLSPGTASITVVNSPSVTISNYALFEISTPAPSVIFSRTDYPTGGSKVKVGDFNGDGKADLAISCQLCFSVTVLLGNGDGTFRQGSTVETGRAPTGMALGDFNGDGILDIAVVNQIDNNVSVLLGNGDGTFRAPRNSPTDSTPLYLATGDFNRDGKLDLAVTYAGHNISVLFGKGDGTFSPPIDYAFGFGTDVEGIATGDFNNDGFLDIAVTGAILYGDGDGNFAVSVEDPLFAIVTSGLAADLNNDGRLDLVGVSAFGTSATVLLAGVDGASYISTTYQTGANPVEVVAGDFNADGRLDLATVNETSQSSIGSVSILLSNGDGTFGDHLDYPVGIFPQSAAAGDFNGDGRLDLVALNDDGTMSVLLEASVPVPIASLSATLVAFPAQQINTTSGTMTVTVTNTGTAALTITAAPILGEGNPGSYVHSASSAVAVVQGAAIIISGANASDFAVVSGTTCTTGTSVAPGNSCVISVTFTPSTATAESATLSIYDNAHGSPQTVGLTGTGVAPTGAPTAMLTPASLNFGTEIVTRSSAMQQAILKSAGTAPLSVTNIVTRGDVSLVGSNCPLAPSSLLIGSSCEFDLAFTPSASGDREGSLAVSTNDPAAPTETVTVTGRGMTPFYQSTSLPQYFDTTSGSICKTSAEGCALTSLSSLISQFDSTTTPSTLDAFLSSNKGYSELVTSKILSEAEQCLIEWPAISAYLMSRGKGLQLVDSKTTPEGEELTFAEASAYLLAHQGDIVIVQLEENSSCKPNFPHYIAVVGPSGSNDWEVFDPGWQKVYSGDPTTLSGHLQGTLTTGSTLCVGQIQRSFTATGFRTFTPTPDPTAMGAKAFSPVELLLTDSEGRQLGSSDGVSDAFDIPSGSYLRDSRPSIDDSTILTGNDQTTAKTVYAPWPLPGVYTLTLTGTNFGPYAAEVFSVSSDGNRLSSVVSGFAAPGSTATYSTSYSSIPGTPLTVTQQAIGSQLGVSSTEISFGNQVVGVPGSSQALGIADTGTAAVAISEISISGSARQDFTIAKGSTCPLNGGNVPTATSCALNIVFTPTAVGSRTAFIMITDNAPGSPRSVTVSGTGISPTVTFGGSVQQPLSKDGNGNFIVTVAVTNQGNVTVDSAQVNVTGTTLGTTSPLAAPAAITNLAPGATATFTLTFPKSAASATATTSPLKISGSYKAGTLAGNWTLTFRSVTL